MGLPAANRSAIEHHIKDLSFIIDACAVTSSYFVVIFFKKDFAKKA
jgi:hypothetical protein